MKKVNTYETILTLVTASVIFSLIFKIKILLSIAVVLGIVGIFFGPLAQIISKWWLHFAELLGSISSKIILSLVFFLFLMPIAVISKIFTKDNLILKNQKASTFFLRNHIYIKEDLEHPW